MPNLNSSQVGQIIAMNKTSDVVIAKGRADISDQIHIPAASGNIATPGTRMLFNVDFGGNFNRFIKNIYIKGMMRIKPGFTNRIIHRGGLNGPIIEEIRLQLNEKNIFLYQNGLAEFGFWSNLSNYSGNQYREFVASNRGFNFEEKNRVLTTEDVVYTTGISPSYLNGSFLNNTIVFDADQQFYIDLNSYTNLFKNASVAHLRKLAIQIQLARGSGAGTLQENLIFGNNDNTVSINDCIQFENCELVVEFDKYLKGAVINPKGPLTVYDNYYEKKYYNINAITDNITVDLNHDFTPMTNMKKLFIFTEPTVLPDPTTESAVFKRLTDAFHRFEIRRNGVEVFRCYNREEWHQHMMEYYNNLCRYPTRSFLGDNINFITDCFIDLSRGAVKINNNKTPVVKMINGLQNFSTKYGQYQIILYPPPGGWPADIRIAVVSQATRLFHLMDSVSYGVNEEI